LYARWPQNWLCNAFSQSGLAHAVRCNENALDGLVRTFGAYTENRNIKFV